MFEQEGTPALPQNSLTLAGERGPANFDARDRFASNAGDGFPRFEGRAARGGEPVERERRGDRRTHDALLPRDVDGQAAASTGATGGTGLAAQRRAMLRSRCKASGPESRENRGDEFSFERDKMRVSIGTAYDWLCIMAAPALQTSRRRASLMKSHMPRTSKVYDQFA